MLVKTFAKNILFKHKYKYVSTHKIFNSKQFETIVSFRFATNNRKYKNNNSNTNKSSSNTYNENINDTINTENDDKTEYHLPKDTLIFKDGKCQIVLADTSQKKLVNFFSTSLAVLNTIFGYKFISHIYYYHPIKAILWGIPFGLCIKLMIGLSGNKQLIIHSIYLLEDGKHLEIEVLKKTFKIKIGEMRIINLHEGKQLMANFSNSLYNDYFPVIINQIVYLLPRNLSINNKDILSAVMSGKYINLNDEEKKITLNNEDIIDI